MAEAKKYLGGCHCGKVHFEVKTDLSRVIECNCSICSKRATLLHFVPEDQFQLLSGESALSDYQFGKKHIHHFFCATCGVPSFAKGKIRDGKPMFAINVRCLEGLDLSTLTITSFDGKKL